MTDIDFDNLFDEPRPTVSYQTRQGIVVLTLRPLGANNLPFMADVLSREKAKAAAPSAVEETALAVVEDGPIAPITEEFLAENRIKTATQLHRWHVAGLTLNGKDRSDLALKFVIALALQDVVKFRALLELAGTSAPTEASPDALAGE